MSFDRIADIVQRAKLAAADGAGSTDSASAAERDAVKTVAAQFESMLLAQMLKEMRKTESWDDNESGEEGDTLGAESFFETLDVELATHLAKVRGLGVSNELVKALDQSRGRAAVGEVAAGSGQGQPVALAATTAAVPDAGSAISVNPGGEVTSHFGWRRDPFSGKATFHRGIDVRAAYGEDIQSAGAGRVVFSGTQRGYGTTVIVQHPDGVQTRYAHLSAALVSAGDELQAGQVVGRAGRSGRATGTHLHFEVIANGRQVDPLKWAETARAAVRPEALKHTGVVADLAISDQSRTLP